jgi:hypothetical protein
MELEPAQVQRRDGVVFTAEIELKEFGGGCFTLFEAFVADRGGSVGEDPLVARLGHGTQFIGLLLKVINHERNTIIAKIVKGLDDPLEAKLDLTKVVRLELFEGFQVCRPALRNGLARTVFEKTPGFLGEPDLQLHFHAAGEACGGIFKTVLTRDFPFFQEGRDDVAQGLVTRAELFEPVDFEEFRGGRPGASVSCDIGVDLPGLFHVWNQSGSFCKPR